MPSDSDGVPFLDLIELTMQKATRPRAQTNLGLALAAYQQKRDIPNEQMAKQIGISGGTLP